MPQGFHRLLVADLRTLCVTPFVESTVRSDIMAGFETIYDRAVAVGIQGEVWIDGSFLTKKIDPGDIDFIFLIDASFHESGTQEQYEFIEWLIDNVDDPKRSFFCHTDVVLLYPEDSPLYPLTAGSKRHWEHSVYGYSVSSREPKGIAVIEVRPTAKEEKIEEEPT